MRNDFTIDHAARGGKAFIRGAGMLVLLVIAVVIAFSSTSCVRTGHVGVVSIFGRVTGQTLSEGIHIVNPVATITELSVKTQEVKEHASVPSMEGLIMGLEASILYHLDRSRAAELFQRIGPNYAEVLLQPTFRCAIRAITAGHTAASLYSDAREAIAKQILEDVQRQVAPRGVVVENVLLRDLQLPDTL